MRFNKCLLHGRSLVNRINMNAGIRNSIICLSYRMNLIPMSTTRNLVWPVETMVVDYDHLARGYLIPNSFADLGDADHLQITLASVGVQRTPRCRA